MRSSAKTFLDSYCLIRDDRRGGIGVGGLFMVAFLAGATFYTSSIAATVNQREGMQQSADAAVFSESVDAARGMNMIASINVLMVALNAVELPLRAMLPSYVKVAQTTKCLDACSCRIKADATRAASQLEALSQTTAERTSDLLTALSDTQTSIAEQVPMLGQTSANRSASDNREFLRTPTANIYSSSLSRTGCRPGLPIQEDSFATVCKRAKKYTAELALQLADETLGTMNGSCTSGALAMADAAPKFPQTDALFCTEANSPPCGGSGPHPKKVVEGGANGSDHMQFWSVVSGRPIKDASGSINPFSARDPASGDGSSDIAFAQSEVYFDCTIDFAIANREEQAMYDTQWTARLRRVNRPTLSFSGDSTVKDEIANPDKWGAARKVLLDARTKSFFQGANTEVGAILMSSQEGPLQ